MFHKSNAKFYSSESRFISAKTRQISSSFLKLTPKYGLRGTHGSFPSINRAFQVLQSGPSENPNGEKRWSVGIDWSEDCDRRVGKIFTRGEEIVTATASIG